MVAAETSDYIERILQQPYTHVLTPDPEGGYSAEILEFPGCFSQGDTVDSAHSNLLEAARSWLAASLAIRRGIPAPLATQDKGWLRVTLPRSTHRLANRMAAREGVSLEVYIASLVAQRVGEATTVADLEPVDFVRALDLVEKAPAHYRELLRPVVLQAMERAELVPFLQLLLKDRYLQHLLTGHEPSPFL